MASTDARPVPLNATAFRLYFAIRKSDGTLITTWAGQDSESSIDGAAFADCTNEATEIGTSGVGFLDLTSGEMTGDCVNVKITVTNTGALPLVFQLYPAVTADYVVTTGAISASAITATSIASDAITAAKVADGTIDAATFAAGAITATVIADGAIDAATFAANAITATAIAADAITAAKVADGTIDAATFAAGAITATVIATGAIDADALATDAVTEIAAGVLTAAGAAPIAADIQAVNAVPIIGDGAGTPWGP